MNPPKKDRVQQLIASVRNHPELGLEYQRRLAKGARDELVQRVVQPVREHPQPGIRKCRTKSKTPLSLQLESFARSIGRIG